MVQPKKPPVSLRLPDDLIAEVEAWAAEHKTTRNAAYAQLIRRGLVPDPAPPKPVVEKLTPDMTKKLTRLAEVQDHAPSGVAMLQRRAFNPQPKKGKAK